MMNSINKNFFLVFNSFSSLYFIYHQSHRMNTLPVFAYPEARDRRNDTQQTERRKDIQARTYDITLVALFLLCSVLLLGSFVTAVVELMLGDKLISKPVGIFLVVGVFIGLGYLLVMLGAKSSPE